MGEVEDEPRRDRRQQEQQIRRRTFLRAGLAAGGLAVTGGAVVAAKELLDSGGSHPASTRARASTTVGPTTTPSTTAAAPPISPVQARWVIEENQRPGSNGHIIDDLGDPNSIEGYFDTVSAKVGDSVRLFVSTTAPQFRVEAYRMGWYQGLGGRLIWQSGDLPGVAQPAPTVDANTNMVEAHWNPSITVDITSDFVPGCYLFRLRSSTGQGRFVPLTIRDDNSLGAFLVVNAVTTWQAYNGWGGYSLYGGGPSVVFANRARIVSFDRPYEDNGAPEFLGAELPVVRLVERMGLDISYSTNVDVHRHPELLLQHSAMVSLGHDEYWSKAMRDGAENARDHGINLLFMGANAAYRQIRFDASALGPERHQICYKSASEDPITNTDPSLATVNWRDPPVTRPEAMLLGEQYQCNPVQADMVVTKPGSWVFANTGLGQGDRIPGIVSGEFDRYDAIPGAPKNVEILAHSPLTCRGDSTFADMTYYNAPSGAGVIDVGTQGWTVSIEHAPAVETITTNILNGFGRGPAATIHPAQPS